MPATGVVLVADVGPPGDPRAESDARVLACAPDLFEVAADLVERLDRSSAPEVMRLRGKSFAEWEAKQRRAREVLAQATGCPRSGESARRAM